MCLGKCLCVTGGQLGIVAEELRKYEQAKSYHKQALKLKTELDDSLGQARTYHQLGFVAQELREYVVISMSHTNADSSMGTTAT